MTSNLANAVLTGMRVWLIYGIVECWFSPLLLWLLDDSRYIVVDPLLVIGTILAYLAIGACCGMLLSRIARGSEQLSVLLSATVILGFTAAYLSLSSMALRPLSVLLFPGLLLAAALAAATSAWALKYLAFLTNPWIVALILTGTTFIIREAKTSVSQLVRLGMAVALAAVLFGIAYLLRARLAAATLQPRWIGLVCVAGLTVAASTTLPSRPPTAAPANVNPGNRPNVLLVVMDTVRADHMSLYGYRRDTTPVLRRLANESLTFTRAISSGNYTLPTHASLFSGVSPRLHGAYYQDSVFRPLPDNFDTLPELLARKGYATAAIIANHGFLGTGFNLNQGFQHYDARMPTGPLLINGDHGMRGGLRNLVARFAPLRLTDRFYKDCNAINREVVLKLEELKAAERPFLLFVNYMDAHDPYLPPEPFDSLFPGRDPSYGSARHARVTAEIVTRKRKLTEAEKAHLSSQYDGGIAAVDHAIGEVVDRLKSLGLYDNTVIIVTSDHGEGFGEHDLMDHGNSVYDVTVKIPLLIKPAAKIAPLRSADVVSTIDIFPTVLDAVRISPTSNTEGRSLLRPAEQSRIATSESFHVPDFDPYTDRFKKTETAVFSDRFKLIVNGSQDAELYDLETDPDETHNLLQQLPAVAKNLQSSAAEWRSRRAVARPTQKNSSEDLERLKSLGYVQ